AEQPPPGAGRASLRQPWHGRSALPPELPDALLGPRRRLPARPDLRRRNGGAGRWPARPEGANAAGGAPGYGAILDGEGLSRPDRAGDGVGAAWGVGRAGPWLAGGLAACLPPLRCRGPARRGRVLPAWRRQPVSRFRSARAAGEPGVGGERRVALAAGAGGALGRLRSRLR